MHNENLGKAADFGDPNWNTERTLPYHKTSRVVRRLRHPHPPRTGSSGALRQETQMFSSSSHPAISSVAAV